MLNPWIDLVVAVSSIALTFLVFEMDNRRKRVRRLSESEIALFQSSSLTHLTTAKAAVLIKEDNDNVFLRPTKTKSKNYSIIGDEKGEGGVYFHLGQPSDASLAFNHSFKSKRITHAVRIRFMDLDPNRIRFRDYDKTVVYIGEYRGPGIVEPYTGKIRKASAMITDMMKEWRVLGSLTFMVICCSVTLIDFFLQLVPV